MPSHSTEQTVGNELSPLARAILGKLVDGTFEIDYERLADTILEQLHDGIPDCRKLSERP